MFGKWFVNLEAILPVISKNLAKFSFILHEDNTLVLESMCGVNCEKKTTLKMLSCLIPKDKRYINLNQSS